MQPRAASRLFPARLRPHWEPSSNPEAQIGGLGPCLAGPASMKLRSWPWLLAPSPRPPPLTRPSLPAPWSLLRASPQSDPAAQPLYWKPGSWSRALSPVAPCFSPVCPPPTSSSPVTWGSFSGPHLDPTTPGLCSCAPQGHLCLYQPPTRSPRLCPLIAPPDFSALHLPDDPRGPGHRASEGLRPWPQPLGRCTCSATGAPASPTGGAQPSGHQPSSREERGVPFQLGFPPPLRGQWGREEVEKMQIK